jgi:hypothetical protein
LLIGRTPGGSFEATWTWQFVRAECRDMSDDDRERLIEAVGYPAFDPQLGIRRE